VPGVVAMVVVGLMSLERLAMNGNECPTIALPNNGIAHGPRDSRFSRTVDNIATLM
jgi:hypothetical protein